VEACEARVAKVAVAARAPISVRFMKILSGFTAIEKADRAIQ
jgi:hypothetical protein